MNIAALHPRERPTADLFWSVERADRIRLVADLARRSRRAIVFCRTATDASRVAGELSRHGVPAASSDQRDFFSERVRVQVLTDEAITHSPPPPAPLVVQFDPASSPRHYRRRVGQVAAPASAVITFVVPERHDEAARLAARLDPALVLTEPDLDWATLSPSTGAMTTPGARLRTAVRSRVRRVAKASVLSGLRVRAGAAARRLRAWLPSRPRGG